MREFIIEPKNGWNHATRDELQKSYMNILGQKHCINPVVLYNKFSEMNIYASTIMWKLVCIDANDILLDLLFNDNQKRLIEFIGTKYEKLVL